MKRSVLGVLVDAVGCDDAVDRIIAAAREGRPLAATALAVHGVLTGVADRRHRFRLNHLDLVTADGQPVRWALNLLHRAGLRKRVYGPDLMRGICAAAAAHGLPVFIYGSRPEVLASLAARLSTSYPALRIAGTQPSAFRRTTPEEKARIVERIRSSGARLAFIGLGCPRQEVFAYEYRDALSMPVVSVGAAFDYLSGQLSEPPALIQRLGFQWLYRLLQEPRRLWKRYVVLNPVFVTLVTLQLTGLWRPEPSHAERPLEEVLYG